MITMEWCNEQAYFALEKLLAIFTIFILGSLVIFIVNRGFERLVRSRRTNRTLLVFWQSIISIFLRGIILALTLSSLGINIRGFLALFGAVGISLSLALKESISNLGSGFVLLFSGNFKIGDKIKLSGREGEIKQIQVMQTVLSVGGDELYIPNSYLVNNFVEKIVDQPLFADNKIKGLEDK